MIMFLIFTIACCSVSTATSDQTTSDEMYSTKFDSIDVDQILKNDRLVTYFYKCLVGTGKCSRDGEEAKRWLLDAIKNQCRRCSEKQKKKSKEIIRFLFEKKSDWWKKLEEKYDPQHVYRQRYMKEITLLKDIK